MKLEEIRTLEDVQAFLEGTQAVVFEVIDSKAVRYRWIERVLIRFNYSKLSKKQRGLVIRLLMKVSGYSRQQVARLVKCHRTKGRVSCGRVGGVRFARRYTEQDIALLVETDRLHDVPNGLAVKKIFERAWVEYGDERFRRLATISVSHIYNLRKSASYQRQRTWRAKTQSRQIDIGTRKRPQPDGKPGYLRVDTVHQGDQDGRKGLYHINAVDQVTQFECVVSVEKITERHLIPALQMLIDGFPFEILGFHTDNGSEYINYKVAELLNKLHIEFTKSRTRHSNDNALVECKNGHVIRKLLGHAHIPQDCAGAVNEFNRSCLFVYVNYHRPCLFAKREVDERGRQKKLYPYERVQTPYEKLKSLPEAWQYLKPGVSFEQLDALAANGAAGEVGTAPRSDDPIPAVRSRRADRSSCASVDTEAQC